MSTADVVAIFAVIIGGSTYPLIIGYHMKGVRQHKREQEEKAAKKRHPSRSQGWDYGDHDDGPTWRADDHSPMDNYIHDSYGGQEAYEANGPYG